MGATASACCGHSDGPERRVNLVMSRPRDRPTAFSTHAEEAGTSGWAQGSTVLCVTREDLGCCAQMDHEPTPRVLMPVAHNAPMISDTGLWQGHGAPDSRSSSRPVDCRRDSHGHLGGADDVQAVPYQGTPQPLSLQQSPPKQRIKARAELSGGQGRQPMRAQTQPGGRKVIAPSEDHAAGSEMRQWYMKEWEKVP